jgi:cytochrome c5
MSLLRVVTLTMAMVLSACGGPISDANSAMEAQSRQLTPQEPAVADIYQRSCKNCHTIAATGAPLTGDKAAWSPRVDKGMAVLADNVVNGFGGMPPFGMCMDCDLEQFEALIRFMAVADQ